MLLSFAFRVEALTWGIKGVGCQGDGSVQMLARGRREQEELIQVLKEMGEGRIVTAGRQLFSSKSRTTESMLSCLVRIVLMHTC